MFSLSAQEAKSFPGKPQNISSVTKQISQIVRTDAKTLPSATRPRAFTAHNTSDVVNASTHFGGDESYAKTHPNALCVTSSVTANLNEICSLGFMMNQRSANENTCKWGGNYIVSMDDDSVPEDLNIPSCDDVSDPNVLCLPPGTRAVSCGVSKDGGVNVGGGNYSLTPTIIAVPKSEADFLMKGYVGCYGAQPNSDHQKYAYTKTSNFQVAYSNPQPNHL